MNKCIKYIYIFLLMSLLLGGLAGCTPGSERPATFWDGLWHGIITPFYWLIWRARPEPVQSTSGYIWGVWIGKIWICLTLVIGVFTDDEQGEDDWLAQLFLLALCISLLIRGLVYLSVYLIDVVDVWFRWLIGEH